MGRKKASDQDKLLKHTLTIRLSDATLQRLEKLLKDSSCRSIGEVARKILEGQRINLFHRDASMNGPMDKMGFYAKGEKDPDGSGGIAGVAEKMGFGGKVKDDKTAEINAKLEQLNREISSPQSDVGLGKSSAPSQATKSRGSGNGNGEGMGADVDRLEMLMKSMKADKQRDPEMDQMNQMLEKILDIQHPARAQGKVVSQVYGAGAEREFLAVPAEVASSGKVVQGSTIRLRLLDSLVLKGVVVPRGHYVFGLCRLVNQRLLLDVKNIRLGNAIIPVELTLYGLDGMAGLSAPDAVFGDVASGGAVDAVGGISVYGLDGIGGQVAGAGIDAAKGLFSRKFRAVRVKLHPGERVLLRVGGN